MWAIIRRLVSRVVAGIVSVWGVITLVFVLGRLAGDPVRLLVPPEATAEQLERTRRSLGLDEPIVVQYWEFLRGAFSGDLGESYYFDQPALPLVLNHLWPTALLALLAVSFAIVLGISFGLLAAFRQGTGFDRILSVLAMVAQAIPAFWLAPVLILVFSVTLGWTPVSGMSGWRSFILPTIALGSFQFAVLLRLTRASALEALNQDYVRLARSKGLRESRLAAVHVLRNTALPLVTVAGLALAHLIGGSVIVESIFSWPGMGNLMIDAVSEKDFPVVQAVALIFAIGYIGLNTVVDVLYAVIDPRVRSERST